MADTVLAQLGFLSDIIQSQHGLAIFGMNQILLPSGPT